MVFVAILLPPALMCLVLALGRYEEWLLRQPAPTPPARHARATRHLFLLPGTGYQVQPVVSESGRRQVADAA